jgi:ABC-2 type transport system permease protein
MGHSKIHRDWRMKKYFFLYLSFIRAGFIADMEYRANFIFRVLTDVIWYIAQVLGFEVLFEHTKIIGTWNVEQTRVFLGLLFVVDALYMIILSDNLDRMTDRVRKGDLDLLLPKPINSQFMVSLQRVSTSLISNFIIASIYFFICFFHLPNHDVIRLLWLLILIPCGLICLYAFRFSIAATSVIFTKADNIQFLWHQVYRLGMRPDHLYSRWLRLTVLSILPVAMVASVPARFVLDPPEWDLALWTVAWTCFVLWASHRFWNFALKFYSSASS